MKSRYYNCNSLREIKERILLYYFKIFVTVISKDVYTCVFLRVIASLIYTYYN